MESKSNAAYLLVSRQDGVTSVPLLGDTSWKLGRGSQCAIVLLDDMVSRTHAMIQRTDSKEYILIDMGSRNGSVVNEQRLRVPPLPPGGRQPHPRRGAPPLSRPPMSGGAGRPARGRQNATPQPP